MSNFPKDLAVFGDDHSSDKYKYCLINVRGCVYRRKFNRFSRISVIIFRLLLFVFVFLFIVFPLIFMHSIELQRILLFTHFGLPNEPSYFENYNISGKRNLYVPVHEVNSAQIIKLGVWHLLPHNLTEHSQNVSDFDHLLKTSNFSVLLYFHGTGEARSYQTGKYEVLRNFFHIITFDYRDYADSTKATLSEDAVISDCLQLYYWLANRTDSDIFIWGHSLGASLAARTLANVEILDQPKGLILESAFTSMRDELYHHPLSSIFSWLPWFEITVIQPLQKNGFVFDTLKYVLRVDVPVMLLCAEDDSIVPYKLTRQIFVKLKEQSLRRNVLYHQFSYLLRYNHFFLYKDPAVPLLIRYFLYLSNNPP